MSHARKRSATQISNNGPAPTPAGKRSRPDLKIARGASEESANHAQRSNSKNSNPPNSTINSAPSVLLPAASAAASIATDLSLTHLLVPFQTSLESLLALLPGAQGFIAILSANQELSLLNRSTTFANIHKISLDNEKQALLPLVTSQVKELIVRGDQIHCHFHQKSNAVSPPHLSSTELVQKGSLGLFRVTLAGDHTAVLGVLIADDDGGLSQPRRRALLQQASLLEQAACSADLKADVQIQQARMNRMREEIQEVQLFYRQFSEAVSQCFWVLDTQTPSVLLVSDNFEKVWGSSRECLNDGLASFVNRVYPGDRDWVLSQFHLQFGEGLDLEFRVIDEVGELRWIWLRSFASRDSAADHPSANLTEASTRTSTILNSTRLVLIADDVTERKQVEEGLRDSEARLAARAKMTAVGELASGVAHEINNPLTVIVGRASELALAAEKGTLDLKKVAETADKIRTTSIRISKIVGSLKSLARKDLGKTVFHSYPLARVVTETSDLCAEKFKNQGVALEIPEIPEGVRLEMDPTLISQLVLNLLNNAADAVEKEPSKWVKIDFTEDKDSVYLFITDSGPGIPLKIRSRIFDPFFTTKDPGRGTGLGLSLSANIALHHHGMLQYDNLSSHTRFVLQLPKLNPNGVAAAIKINAGKTSTPPGRVG